ncbi:MAG TPA: diguanylate cyclase [Candidatus Limnocylindrales bacterium]
MPLRQKSPAFGSLPHPPRPVLLLIVYGLFLVVVGVTATAQTILVSANFANAALTQVVGSDAGSVRAFVNINLLESDLSPNVDADRRTTLANGLQALIRNGNLSHIEIRLPDGTIAISEDPSLGGTRIEPSADFERALTGIPVPNIVRDGAATEAAASLEPQDVIREYLPVSTDGTVRAVIGVWRDAAPVLQALDGIRQQVVLVTISGALVAAVFLFFVFRAAQGRIRRQTTALIEATRRDAVTGLLNHGAIVTELADRIEVARKFGEQIGIALIDVDGFRLLNDTYGHDAGDTALLQVRDRLRAELANGIIGRYGPDEYLVVADSVRVTSLESALERLRQALAQESLDVDASERLPITVSAAVCVYPTEGESVSALLATAVQTLTEAKASGGDAIRVAGRQPVASADARTFDVFQGLVLAVDAKDRYTKRHSEDVARYAMFLAKRVGLDQDTLRTIRVAGLLHDVGKIGIPDSVLRKPGKLTDDEYDIVKQHVALGDMIVRDLPNIDEIRAGVRHHHERWDGRGYLHALRGQDIPLIARILAVADAFSAMTTTRPYRRALMIEEALKRLEDAAGSQLDEQLVAAFTEGIRTQLDAPSSGTEGGNTRIWLPSGQVA